MADESASKSSTGVDSPDVTVELGASVSPDLHRAPQRAPSTGGRPRAASKLRSPLLNNIVSSFSKPKRVSSSTRTPRGSTIANFLNVASVDERKNHEVFGLEAWRVSDFTFSDASFQGAWDDGEIEHYNRECRKSESHETFLVNDGWLLLMPDSSLSTLWNTAVVVFIVLQSAILVPFEIALSECYVSPKWFEVIVWVVYVLDIAVQMITPYRTDPDKLLELSPQKIRRNYVMSLRFVVDLVSCVPVWAVDWSTDDVARSSYTFAKVLRLQRFSTLAFAKVFSQFANLELYQLLVLYILLGHWLACLWCFVGTKWQCFYFTYEETPECQISIKQSDVDSSIDGDLVTVGCSSLYFTALAQGLGSLYAGGFKTFTPAETIMYSFSILCGAVFTAFVVGLVTSLVSQTLQGNFEYEERLKVLRTWANRNNLDAELTKRVLSFHTKLFYRYNVLDAGVDQQVVSTLPTAIQNDVKVSLYRAMVHDVHIFSETQLLTRAVLLTILKKLRVVYFMDREVIVQRGTTPEEGMHFIETGFAGVIDPSFNLNELNVSDLSDVVERESATGDVGDERQSETRHTPLAIGWENISDKMTAHINLKHTRKHDEMQPVPLTEVARIIFAKRETVRGPKLRSSGKSFRFSNSRPRATMTKIRKSEDALTKETANAKYKVGQTVKFWKYDAEVVQFHEGQVLACNEDGEVEIEIPFNGRWSVDLEMDADSVEIDNLENGEVANPGTYHRVKGEWQLAAQAPPPVKKVYVGRSSTPYTAPDSKVQDRHHEYFFGHLGMCLNETRGVTVIALTLCKAAELSRAEWVEVCNLHEEFGAAVYAAAKKESRQKQASNEEGSKRRLASMIREHNSRGRGLFGGD